MNVNILIDSIVRQTTILIAQLATAGGNRQSLAHTANQVFVSLVRELKDQGVANKVIADMFGLALRTYHDKVRRLQESSTYGGRSLWEAVLAFVQERGTVPQADVLLRFRNDDQLTVRGVLKDLVDGGIVFRSGRGGRTVYRAATPDELNTDDRRDEGESIAHFIWVAVQRYGPVTMDQLLELVPMDETSSRQALDKLVKDGRVARSDPSGQVVYSCDGCFIPQGSDDGWEAAVFDHYQALVTAVCTKLARGTSATDGEIIGGSTYSYFVWDGHPMRGEVVSFLQRTREQAAALRARVAKYNATSDLPQDQMTRVISYVGQTILEPQRVGEDE